MRPNIFYLIAFLNSLKRQKMFTNSTQIFPIQILHTEFLNSSLEFVDIYDRLYPEKWFDIQASTNDTASPSPATCHAVELSQKFHLLRLYFR